MASRKRMLLNCRCCLRHLARHNRGPAQQCMTALSTQFKGPSIGDRIWSYTARAAANELARIGRESERTTPVATILGNDLHDPIRPA